MKYAKERAQVVWRASDHWSKRLDALDHMKRTGDFSPLDRHFDSSKQELERKERDLVGRERQEEWECRKPEQEREQVRREWERREHERRKREYWDCRREREQKRQDSECQKQQLEQLMPKNKNQSISLLGFLFYRSDHNSIEMVLLLFAWAWLWPILIPIWILIHIFKTPERREKKRLQEEQRLEQERREGERLKRERNEWDDWNVNAGNGSV